MPLDAAPARGPAVGLSGLQKKDEITIGEADDAFAIALQLYAAMSATEYLTEIGVAAHARPHP
jgi:hypothetical protein